MGLDFDNSNCYYCNPLEMSYYKLKVPAGSYEADSLPRLLWEVFKHRCWHLWKHKKWMD